MRTGHLLERIRDIFMPKRELIGVDLSSTMVKLAQNRLGESASVVEGSMTSLPGIEAGSCAAVLSFYAVHHVDLSGLEQCLARWNRVLVRGGVLLLAAWEGSGNIDYGEHSDIVARRYLASEINDVAVSAGFQIVHCDVKPVDGFDMDAVDRLANAD